jgi:hypothetical protein
VIFNGKYPTFENCNDIFPINTKPKRTIKNNKRVGKLQFMGVVGQYQSRTMKLFL